MEYNMKKSLFHITYGNKHLPIKLLDQNLAFAIEPRNCGTIRNENKRVLESLRHPIGCEPLTKQIRRGMKITIIIDDITRPTPQNRLLPIILEELYSIGVREQDIVILIALGTHEYMSEDEIKTRVGGSIFNTVKVVNNEWKNNDTFVNLGKTEIGNTVWVNRIATESDFIIGIGSIVPHSQAGWSGGAKIVQPGICSSITTGQTHMLAVYPECLDITGQIENNCRLAIEKVAEKAGLKFILNVIIDGQQRLVDVVSGHPVLAQRQGIQASRNVYEREISELADIILVSASPGEIDYWQGIKALAHAQRGIKKGGTIVLFGSFPRGISKEHPEMEMFATKNYKELDNLCSEGKIKDMVNASTLFVHSLILEKCSVICVSNGLSTHQTKALGFVEAENVEDALEKAVRDQGHKSKIGIIDYGSDVLPVLV
jgi:nickel-dependent lactate racemase